MLNKAVRGHTPKNKISLRMNNSFGKAEKILNSIEIAEIFDVGQSVGKFPMRIWWNDGNAAMSRLAVGVSKKKFKRAVDRNLLKRRMREAYRLNKACVFALGKDMVCIYLGKRIESFEVIENAMLHMLEQIKR